MAGLADRYVVLLSCAADRAPSACAAKVLHVKVGRRLGQTARDMGCSRPAEREAAAVPGAVAVLKELEPALQDGPLPDVRF